MVDPHTLPTEIAALRDRVRAFLVDELLPAEEREQVVDPAQASPALRRFARTRSAELGFYRLAQPLYLGGGGLGPGSHGSPGGRIGEEWLEGELGGSVAGRLGPPPTSRSALARYPGSCGERYRASPSRPRPICVQTAQNRPQMATHREARRDS
jgi:hypothetical protein